MQCESGYASIPPSRELEALPLSDSARKKVADPCLLQGVSARLPHHKWPWHVVPSIWRPARPQGSSWRAGRKDRVSGTVGRITAIPAKSYGPTFCVLVTLHPNIERYDLYIYMYMYLNISIYTYVHISRITGGFLMKIPKGTCAASLSQDSRGTSTSLSHLAGQIDDRRFSCGHYTICLLLKHLEERTLSILAGG